MERFQSFLATPNDFEQIIQGRILEKLKDVQKSKKEKSLKNSDFEEIRGYEDND